MKYSELQDLTSNELTAKAHELRQECFTLRMQQASAQLEKTARIRLLRRSVARIETRLSALNRSKTSDSAK